MHKSLHDRSFGRFFFANIATCSDLAGIVTLSFVIFFHLSFFYNGNVKGKFGHTNTTVILLAQRGTDQHVHWVGWSTLVGKGGWRIKEKGSVSL